MDDLQLMVGGLANGCVYGLIALGFVLIYKATEQVNFAQGDMMMLGAFIAIGLGNESHGGLPFWLACAGAILIMAAFGMAVERTLLRPLFGQSQIAVVILTIAFGFVLRFVAGAVWGHDPLVMDHPVAGTHVTFGRVVLSADEIAVIVVTLLLTGLLFLFFARTKLGIAMQAASQNQLAAYYTSQSGRAACSCHAALYSLSSRSKAHTCARSPAPMAPRGHRLTSVRTPRTRRHAPASACRSRGASPSPRRRDQARWHWLPVRAASRACSRAGPWQAPVRHVGCR